MDASQSPQGVNPHSSPSPSPIVIDGISYIPSSALLTGIPKFNIKDNSAFAVVDPLGEAPRVYSPGSELGFYCSDTRYVGVWEMTFNGERPISLAQEQRFGGHTLVISMTNRDMPELGGGGRIPRDTILVRRILSLVEDVLYETVEIRNFDSKPHALQVEQWVGTRFEDLFEVRGYARPKRGRMLAPLDGELRGAACIRGRAGGGEGTLAARDWRFTSFQYEGLDGRTRRTHVYRLFSAEKIRVSPSLAGYFTRIRIPAKETVSLKTVVSFDRESDCCLLGLPFEEVSTPQKMRLLVEWTRPGEGVFTGPTIVTDHAIVSRAIQNAQADIFMLLTEEHDGLLYPYAGIPWFSAPFGRDGMITAYQLLPWYPALARGVLQYAFDQLGDRVDPFTDEQPGKVFHEMRRGEMALTREVPFIPYYGSVDATPLCLILLHEYVRWTQDLESLRKWWPEALRALAWINRWGDSDGDGFLEYAKQSPNGLVNQGWKDSHDSIMHADGRFAVAPIRLCEVQGYAFRARLGMSGLARLLGKGALADRLRLEALELKARFADQFWDEKRKSVYLALAGHDRQPCKVLTSNMGHCLWSQILTLEQARSVTDHLMSDALFSGYGIRTLAGGEVAFNPLSYHNGSVWPHDNSIIMEGFRNYGFTDELDRLATALIEVLEVSDDFRLPELFCGFRKRGDTPPVPYEVACKPQAWAAGSVFLMLRSLLGISIEAEQRYLVCNTPRLTGKLNHLEIRGLRGPDWEMDLLFRRGRQGTVTEVLRRSGKMRVLTVK
ncbi:MAG: hypothetical protein NDJ90_16210 [Oligoflexia bacterium]|nr:hypothetical protein [Oligoflexia bacterium]